MKILILAEYYSPYIMGGGEISLKQFVDGLIDKGHAIYILTPNCGFDKTTIYENEKLVIHRYKSIKYKTYKQNSKKISSEIYNKNQAIFQLILSLTVKIFSWEMVIETKKVLQKNKFDLIYSNNIESMIALSKLKLNTPTVAHIRDLAAISLNYRTYNKKYSDKTSIKIIKKYFNTNWLLAKLIIIDIINRRKRVLEKIDFFITINDFIKDEIIKEGIDENSISVIYNPIKNVISHLTKKEAKKKLNLTMKYNILFVGSLTKIKGAQYIVPIAKLIPNFNFIVIGNGPYKDKIINSKLTNIRYIENLDNIADYYKACDLLLLLQTVHYGIGRVAIEAMLNGTPIISTNIKGIDNFIINNVTGSIVCHWTPITFCLEIERLLFNEPIRNIMSNNCKKLVKEKFSTKYSIDKLEKIFKEIKDAKFMYNGHLFSK